MPRKDDTAALGVFRDVVWEQRDVLRGSLRGAPGGLTPADLALEQAIRKILAALEDCRPASSGVGGMLRGSPLPGFPRSR
jgi:hypothetical protein